jgi:hypothetical protein
MRISIFISLLYCLLSSCREEKKAAPVALNKHKIDSLLRVNPYLQETYCNTRFTYCVNYPVLLMFPLPEAANGDGRIFNNKDGREVMRVFARPLPPSYKDWLTIKRVMEHDLQQLNDENTSGQLSITEKQSYQSHYVIRGTTAARYFHQKALLTASSIVYVILQYDPAERPVFEPVADSLLSSLK